MIWRYLGQACWCAVVLVVAFTTSAEFSQQLLRGLGGVSTAVALVQLGIALEKERR